MRLKAEQAHVEKLATLDLAIALYALQDCSFEYGIKLVTTLTPLLAVRSSVASQTGSRRRLDQSVRPYADATLIGKSSIRYALFAQFC